MTKIIFEVQIDAPTSPGLGASLAGVLKAETSNAVGGNPVTVRVVSEE